MSGAAARLLARVLGRTPLGWLQLTHNRARMATAIAGIAFANVLVFVQLGMLGALNGSIGASYTVFEADILVSPSDANTFTDGSTVARRLLYRALSVPGVAAGTPLYLAQTEFLRPDGTNATVEVYGMRPEAAALSAPTLRQSVPTLALENTALLDAKMRGLDPEAVAGVALTQPMAVEVARTAVAIVGVFPLGGGFTADGSLIVSDQTFLRLFPGRTAGTPSHLLLKAMAGEDPEAVAGRVAAALGDAPVKVRTVLQATADDLAYQQTQRPIGIIFGMGVAIGVLVGIVVVYQVLSTDVADHLKEYATFKAMGFPHRFFLGVVFEQSIILACLGFVPGAVLSSGIYFAMAAQTGLTVEMTEGRAIMVFLGTLAACAVSGAIATRRLAGADPAELF